jgi:glycosyltransferase involved in cell wall biosynthesis
VGLAAYDAGPWPEGVEAWPSPAPTALRPSRSGPTVGKPALDAMLAVTVARALASGRYDVVHAHNVEAPFVAWVARRLAGCRVPVVYDAHTALAEELPTYAPDRWAAPLARLGQGVDRLLGRRADACVALSARGEARLRALGARHVLRSPPGVDPAELAGGDADRARARWDLGTDRWVAYTGNADRYQDLDVLLAAMVRVDAARLLVVGPSDPAVVRDAAARAGLAADRLVVVRSDRREDALDALAVAEVGAVPRSVCAGFPMKLLNVLGAGRAAVVASGSAIPVEGVIPVPDRDVASFAGALAAALDRPEATRRLGDAAARAVRATWTWEASAARLDPWLRDVVARGTTHR